MAASYPRQREYPHPPPPSTNNTTTTINRVVIFPPLLIQDYAVWGPKRECVRTHGRRPKLPQNYYAQVLPATRTGQPSSFLQRVELRRLDAQGRVKLSEVRTYDVTLQQGTPYRQLVQRDDRPVARHRGEKGAGKAGQEYRRPTARDRTGASQVPVRILGGARIGSGTPGTSCRMLRVSSCRRRWAGWPRQLHHRGNAAQGIPDPIRHRQGVSLSQRQILAWTNKTARS
jgi:hypothetical protein